MQAIRHLLFGVLIGLTVVTGGALLLVVSMIGFALLTEPDEWRPGGGANIGLGLLMLTLGMNLPTALGWILWWHFRNRVHKI